MMTPLIRCLFLATGLAGCTISGELQKGYTLCTDQAGPEIDQGAPASAFRLPLTSCTAMPPKNGGPAPPRVSLKLAPPDAISIDSVESCAGKTGNAAYEVVCTIDKATFARPGFDSSIYRITVDETHFLPTYVAGPINIIAAGIIRIIQSGAREVVYTTSTSFTETIPPKGTVAAGSPSYLWQPLHKLKEGNLEVRFLVYVVCQAPGTDLADPISWTVHSITLTPIAASCGS